MGEGPLLSGPDANNELACVVDGLLGGRVFAMTRVHGGQSRPGVIPCEGELAKVGQRLNRRPAQWVVTLVVVLLAGLLVLLAGLSWRNLSRLRRIDEQVAHTSRLVQFAFDLQSSLLANIGSSKTNRNLPVRRLLSEVEQIRALPTHLNSSTRERLGRLQELIEKPGIPTDARLATALRLARVVVVAESDDQERLLASIREDTHRQLEIGTSVAVGLAAIALLGYWLVRFRIARPLEDLRGVMTQLAGGKYQRISVAGTEPLLIPLFEKYNDLVTRLKVFEEGHRTRATSLEKEVRAATQALLEQQRSLAHAERLAAVGETAAGLAHELRNPLAGILLSLENLRREHSEPDLRQRFDSVTAELQRLTRLLNQNLAAARHAPEMARTVDLRELVADLLALLHYQVAEGIRLESLIPESLTCRLPRDRIRQALLNLVLNSVQAIGGSPGRIVVAAAGEDDQLVLTVTDDGPGFPEELLRVGVRSFASRTESGTGLGLVMVRRLAEDLGGRLYLERAEGRGARVRLVLPCCDE